MRIGFIALIYKKLLSLSMAHTASGGIIVNMVSNDVQRFEDASPFSTFLILGPLELCIATYFIWRQISWAAFASVGALLLLIPIQALIARRFLGLRKGSVFIIHTVLNHRSITEMIVFEESPIY
jgi:ATP-binding cassette subfamily C (CFTR/MRP) protein 4